MLGGPDGIDNLQAKQLANRTAFLKGLVEGLASGKQPLDATLTALAAIATAADKLIYATGADTFATTTLSAFIRTLLDDADAATARTTLGAAALASPTFTGTPAAPTAVAGTNTTQLATTAFVQAAVAALIDSSPAALNTLNELAAALGDDANFAATMTTALAGKQPLDATLTALAAVVTAADKLIYSTGADTFATTTLSAFARTLLDDANAATARTTLGAISAGDIPGALNASGSAPIYACRAWVNFNGTGTPAIMASGNVSSITDDGVGRYTVNFSTAMPDANYCVHTSAGGSGATGSSGSIGSAMIDTGTASVSDAVSLKTTTQVRVSSAYSSGGSTYGRYDAQEYNVSVFR